MRQMHFVVDRHVVATSLLLGALAALLCAVRAPPQSLHSEITRVPSRSLVSHHGVPSVGSHNAATHAPAIPAIFPPARAVLPNPQLLPVSKPIALQSIQVHPFISLLAAATLGMAAFYTALQRKPRAPEVALAAMAAEQPEVQWSDAPRIKRLNRKIPEDRLQRENVKSMIVQETGQPNMNAAAQHSLAQAYDLFETMRAQNKSVSAKLLENLLYHLAGANHWEQLVRTNNSRTTITEESGPMSSRIAHPTSSEILDPDERSDPIPGERSALDCAESIYTYLIGAGQAGDSTAALMARIRASVGDLKGAEDVIRESGNRTGVWNVRNYLPVLIGWMSRGDMRSTLRLVDAIIERDLALTSADLLLLLENMNDVPPLWVENLLRRAHAALEGDLDVQVVQHLQTFFGSQPDYEVTTVSVDSKGQFAAGDKVHKLTARSLDPDNVLNLQKRMAEVVEAQAGNNLRRWLRGRPGYDVVIDGSSAGSVGRHNDFKYNPDATLAFGQIQAVIDAAKQYGFKRPLIILPRRFTQNLPPAESAWVATLIELEALFASPYVQKNDWSVTYTALMRNIPYITRDLRQDDLREQLKDQRCFEQWRQSRLIGFKFRQDRSVQLFPPARYERRMQPFSEGWMVPLEDGQQWLQIRALQSYL